MAIYIIFFAAPLFFFLQNTKAYKKRHYDYFCLMLIAAFLIGYRYNTGGDWGNYYAQFIDVGDQGFLEYVLGSQRHSNEFLFNAVYWFGYNYLDFYLVSFIFTVFSFYALYCFARYNPYFWLTITLAIPFFVVVMIMGYTRQGLALSILMIAIPLLVKNKIAYYMIGVFLATGFHNSAIIFSAFAFPALINSKRYRFSFLLIMLPIVLLSFNFVHGYFYTKIQHYNHQGIAAFAGKVSDVGAIGRILINAVAGVIFFVYSKRWKYLFPHDYIIWKMLSIASLFCIPLLFVFSPNSIDRIVFYLMIVQLAVWPRIIYMTSENLKAIIFLCCIFGYSGILIIWLIYGLNSQLYWLPFRHYFFEAY